MSMLVLFMSRKLVFESMLNTIGDKYWWFFVETGTIEFIRIDCILTLES